MHRAGLLRSGPARFPGRGGGRHQSNSERCPGEAGTSKENPQASSRRDPQPFLETAAGCSPNKPLQREADGKMRGKWRGTSDPDTCPSPLTEEADGLGTHPEAAAVAALPSSRLAGVMSASPRTTTSDSRSPTNKPLTSRLIWG